MAEREGLSRFAPPTIVGKQRARDQTLSRKALESRDVSVDVAGDFAFSRLYGDNVILASEKPLQENTPSILTDIQRRNTMGIFGKSFDKKVQEAVAALGRSGLGVPGLTATVAATGVTLEGEGDTMEAKGRVMSEFNKLIDTENTINRIRVKESLVAPQVPPPAAPRAAEETTYVVQSGDPLGAVAPRV